MAIQHRESIGETSRRRRLKKWLYFPSPNLVRKPRVRLFFPRPRRGEGARRAGEGAIPGVGQDSIVPTGLLALFNPNRSPAQRRTMLLRIGCIILAIRLAAGEAALTAAEPPAPDDIAIFHDIPYREGTSRQCRLDLAMKKERRGVPRPGIVVIHGGGWVEGDKSSFASREHRGPQ